MRGSGKRRESNTAPRYLKLRQAVLGLDDGQVIGVVLGAIAIGLHGLERPRRVRCVESSKKTIAVVLGAGKGGALLRVRVVVLNVAAGAGDDLRLARACEGRGGGVARRPPLFPAQPSLLPSPPAVARIFPHSS